jgi:hypothetical protein
MDTPPFKIKNNFKMELLSQRKYAKTIGVSHAAVNKAVVAGHIKRGFDKKTKKIKAKIANNEWGNDIREKHKNKADQNENDTIQLSHLSIAVTNYFKARNDLLTAIEHEFGCIIPLDKP